MKNRIIAIVSWAMAIWACYIFLGSLPYKFTNHPDTQHIFGTIGTWMSDVFSQGLGSLFTSVGPYGVGAFELATSIVLLLPAILWVLPKIGIGEARSVCAKYHSIGGAMAAVVMAGAVFFHLFTPLGIEVLHQGKSDGGSLFYSAVSILIFGIILFVMNRKLEP